MKKVIIISLFVLGLIMSNINVKALSLHGLNIEQKQIVKKTGYAVIAYSTPYSPIFDIESECQNYLTENYNSNSNYACTKIEYDGGGDGLYADEYTNGRYVYRGANPNNYIKFNNELWRIIAFEPDGTVKILRSKVLPEKRAIDSIGARTTGYCSLGSSLRIGCDAWAATSNLVGMPDKFVNGEYEGIVDKDSEMLTYLNGEYYNKLTAEAKEEMTNHDYNIGSSVSTGIHYEGDGDTLPNIVKTEQEYKWNGKVGLISASDYLHANSNQDMCNTHWKTSANMEACVPTNWMYIDGTSWHTLTVNQGGTGMLWGIWDDGVVTGVYSYQLLGVRPALYLNSNIYLKGNGTEDSPYEITDKPSDTQIENNESTENQNPQIVNVPSTSAYASIIIIVLGIICVIVSVFVMRRVTSKNNS